MKRWMGLLLCPLLCALQAGAAQAGQTETRLLIPIKDGSSIKRDSMEQRARRVQVNLPLLRSLSSDQPHNLKIELFPDAQYEVTLTRCKTRSATSCTWSGYVKGHPESPIFLTMEGAIVLLNLTIAGKTQFQVRPESGGTEIVSEAVANGNRRCGGTVEGLPTPLDVTDPARYGHQLRRNGVGVQDIVTIDVLMFYTTAAKNSLGGTAGIRAQCQASVDKANEVHNNNGTNVQLNMLDAQEIPDFSEENSYSNMLSNFRNNAYVRATRDALGADLVGLLVSNREWHSDTSLTIGLAYLYNGSDERAYSVTNYLDATTGYVFAHETGHNFGCGHAADDPGSGAFSYSHGYKFTLNLIGLYRTVMAYDETGGFRTLIPYFSDPDQVYTVGLDSTHIGNASNADNFFTIKITAPTIANFRNLYTDHLNVYVNKSNTGYQNGSPTHPFKTVQAAVNFAAQGATIYIAAGSYQDTPNITKVVNMVNWHNSGNAIVGAP